ncbi:hypothetical protein [Thalassospira xiamenensis]|uniref:hypothetical protein n=1 Tax=Thalassospira xiamenensis TaxID=220697 RepID=UPI003AA85FC0
MTDFVNTGTHIAGFFVSGAVMKNDERFHMRVSQNFLDLLDDWRRQQPDIPSRAESIRRLVTAGYCFDVHDIDIVFKSLLDAQIAHPKRFDFSEAIEAIMRINDRVADSTEFNLDSDSFSSIVDTAKEAAKEKGDR